MEQELDKYEVNMTSIKKEAVQQTLEEKHLGDFVVGILTKLVWSSIISITHQVSYLYWNCTMVLPIQLYIISNGNLQIILMLPEN